MGEDELRNSTETIRTTTAPFNTQPSVGKSCPLSPLEAANTEVTIELIRSSAALRLRQWSASFESFLALHRCRTSRPPDANLDATIALIKLHKVMMVIIYFEINY
jgi:hypothetical protein